MKKILLSILALGIVGLIVFLFLGGKKLLLDFSITEEKPATYAELAQKTIEKQKNDIDLYNEGIKTQDPKHCEDISENNKKIECREMIEAGKIRNGGSLEDCSKLTTETIRGICNDAVLFDQAIKKTDTTLCAQIQESARRDNCQEKVDTESLKQKRENGEVTVDFCNSLGETQKNLCMMEVREIDDTSMYKKAIAEENIELCDQITKTSLQEACINFIAITLAGKNNDTKWCEKIMDTAKKSYCLSRLSKQSDVTIYKTAIESKDISKCEKIGNTNIRNKCHDTILIETIKSSKDTSLCDRLQNTSLIPACKNIR